MPGQAGIPAGDPRIEVVQAFPTLVFGNSFLGSIHGYKFEDLNGNGLDDADPRLPGVEITLTGTDGLGNAVNATATTDANGEYAFSDLLPGEYTVTETPPAGSVPTTAGDLHGHRREPRGAGGRSRPGTDSGWRSASRSRAGFPDAGVRQHLPGLDPRLQVRGRQRQRDRRSRTCACRASRSRCSAPTRWATRSSPRRRPMPMASTPLRI